MYLDFFGLRENPFSLVSDARFLYYSESHCEAMAHLLYGIRERKGIILLLGEAGTGKTTLVRATLEMLKSTRVLPSVILNPLMSQPEEFLEAVLKGFGLQIRRRSNAEMCETLQTFLVQQTGKHMIPVLIVDEAQGLSQQFLEQLRLLSNFEHAGHKLLQFVLAAQPEMQSALDTFELRALRQRILVRCRLTALNAQDCWNYLQTRLLRAGGDGRPIFTVASVGAIFAFSAGIPRLMNALADNCLLAAYAQNSAAVDVSVVETVAQDLELSSASAPGTSGISVQRDVMRASMSWKEIREDLRRGSVPQPLQDFVEKLQVPGEPNRLARFAQFSQKGQ